MRINLKLLPCLFIIFPPPIICGKNKIYTQKIEAIENKLKYTACHSTTEIDELKKQKAFYEENQKRYNNAKIQTMHSLQTYCANKPYKQHGVGSSYAGIIEKYFPQLQLFCLRSHSSTQRQTDELIWLSTPNEKDISGHIYTQPSNPLYSDIYSYNLYPYNSKSLYHIIKTAARIHYLYSLPPDAVEQFFMEYKPKKPDYSSYLKTDAMIPLMIDLDRCIYKNWTLLRQKSRTHHFIETSKWCMPFKWCMRINSPHSTSQFTTIIQNYIFAQTQYDLHHGKCAHLIQRKKAEKRMRTLLLCTRINSDLAHIINEFNTPKKYKP